MCSSLRVSQIDQKCSDVGWLCFLSYDPEAYLNEDAIELAPFPEPEKESKSKAAQSDPQIQLRCEIATELLGEIDWDSETLGYCDCPGQELHSGRYAPRDCRVTVDGAPTIYCFHQSCSEVIEEQNRELRSRIGKAENAAAAAKAEEADEGHVGDYPENDSDRAIRFAKEFGGDLRYVAAWKSWLYWDGTRWVRDTKGHVMRKAQEMSKILLEEASQIEKLNERKRAATLALKAGDVQKLKAMIEIAGAQEGIAASPEIFDADPYLLGVKNGVLDLRDGFREARKEDYLTKQADVEYDPKAKCPRWEAFLSYIFKGDKQLLEFMQSAIGYGFSGLTIEQVLFFLYGTGRNGKSTLTETVQDLLGDYAQHAPAALFVSDRSGREPEKEIARLVGTRFVVGSEIEEGAKLAESRVKDLTGQDTLTGRFLYGSPFDFLPTHKLWIFGNHQPDIAGTDMGIWRRMRLVPFEVQIPDNEVDPMLPSKLLLEKSGILNWAIKGFKQWERNGLIVPASVRAATDEYRDTEDELGDFIEELCVLDPEKKVPYAHLHRAYLHWARTSGIKVPHKVKAFNKRIGSRAGITKGKSGVAVWCGLAFRHQPEGVSEGTSNFFSDFFP